VSIYHIGTIKALADWIDENLDQPLTIDDIALKSGYTKWHMQRLFKSVTGYAVAHYIRARKLTNAAIAIRLTRERLDDISAYFYFCSPQSFSRAFNRQFGMSPLAYRKMGEWSSTGFVMPFMTETISVSPVGASAFSRENRCVWLLKNNTVSCGYFRRIPPDEMLAAQMKALVFSACIGQRAE